MSGNCPQCDFAAPAGAEECPRCGVLFRKLGRRLEAGPRSGGTSAAVTGRLTVDALEPEGARSLAIGLVLALVFLFLPFLGFVLGYLTILVHELGHAAAGWLFGYPSVPAFDFQYGGGVTGHQGRQLPLVVFVIIGLVYSMWCLRRRRAALIVLAGVTATYMLFAFTWLHEALITFMGHGSELVFAGIFLYRAISGSAIKIRVERPLYAFVGWFIVLQDLRFAWGLIHDPAERAAYEDAKGGGHWMDFSVLAEQHFHVDLSEVAGLFFLCCLLPPLAAWLAYRHRAGWIRLCCRIVGSDEEFSGVTELS